MAKRAISKDALMYLAGNWKTSSVEELAAHFSVSTATVLHWAAKLRKLGIDLPHHRHADMAVSAAAAEIKKVQAAMDTPLPTVFPNADELP